MFHLNKALIILAIGEGTDAIAAAARWNVRRRSLEGQRRAWAERARRSQSGTLVREQ